jgi:uncharacterized protein DUF3631
MTAEELLAQNGIRLDSTAPGRHYTTCPKCSTTRSRAHQSNKVLGVTIEADGKVRWGCNHCGWRGPPKGSGTVNGGREPLHSYVYRDARGWPRFRKVRNRPDRKPRFWLEQPDEGARDGWRKGTKGVDTKILYRADEVAKAIAEGRIIVVAEGEKDVDALVALGCFAATCNAHGASEPGKQPKWTKAHSEQLAGADIVVLGDHDAAGYEHQEVTCKLSHGVAKRVRKLTLAAHWPGIQKGGDVSDWLAAGHTGEELEELIASAPDYVPTEQAEESRGDEQEPSAADAEITRLAKLKPAEYEHQRKSAAENLGFRASILDRLVRDERARLGLDGGDDRLQGTAISLPEPEPWSEEVDGVVLLDGIAKAIRTYVVLTHAACHEAALWIVHSYLTDCFLVSPRLCVRSPTKQCGKTTLLDVLSRLVPRPLSTSSVTPAAVFRVIEGYKPTLLIDEADTFLRDDDGLRGVLNGNRQGSQVLRTVGEQHEVRAFATYSACVIALIGTLPDTLHDRSIVLELKRRLPSEKVEPFRPDRAGHLDVLARKAARWAQDHADWIAAADPQMPGNIVNRAADNQRPLLAIADEAKGDWPERARKAAEAAHIAATDDAESRLELLLRDVRDAFADKTEMPSADLVKALVELEGRPWAELGKSRKPLTQNGLARRLKPLGIAPGHTDPQTRIRGYKLTQFEEAFSRYLPPEGDSNCSTVQNAANTGTSSNSQPFNQQLGRTVAESLKPNNDGVSNGRTVARGSTGANGSDEPGLSTYQIRSLADEYTEAAYANAQANDGDTHTTELDADLRRRLAEMVLPELVEDEFTRVMTVVFAV